MAKRNSGINDRRDAGGEQSHMDGNSGLENRIDGEDMPDPPDLVTRAQAKGWERRAKRPTPRDDDIL